MSTTKKQNVNQETPIAMGADGYPLSSCRVCGSTNRGPMVESSRLLHDGKVHIWVRTICTDCGQTRIDRIESRVAVGKAKSS